MVKTDAAAERILFSQHDTKPSETAEHVSPEDFKGPLHMMRGTSALKCFAEGGHFEKVFSHALHLKNHKQS